MARRVLRANRLAPTSSQVDRGAKLAPRHDVDYWCAADHLTQVPFAADAEPPERWLCYACGAPAGPDRGGPPAIARPRVFPRTPYEFLMMRRTEEEGDRLLAQAVANLRRRRREGS